MSMSQLSMESGSGNLPNVSVAKSYISITKEEPLVIECTIQTTSPVYIMMKHNGKQLKYWNSM